MPQVKALFYLPLQDSDGRDLTIEINEVRTELFAHFDGWTFLGFVDGAFRMADGTQASDRSAAYVVVLEESQLFELRKILSDFKGRTQQEAIYLEIQRDTEFEFL